MKFWIVFYKTLSGKPGLFYFGPRDEQEFITLSGVYTEAGALQAAKELALQRPDTKIYIGEVSSFVRAAIVLQPVQPVEGKDMPAVYVKAERKAIEPYDIEGMDADEQDF